MFVSVNGYPDLHLVIITTTAEPFVSASSTSSISEPIHIVAFAIVEMVLGVIVIVFFFDVVIFLFGFVALSLGFRVGGWGCLRTVQ